ncbi:hypothetical protein B0H63DRAFT_519059 [Podospora didyma]|uniref:Uncharacterized protein n=1 Tax=Podospora didyma TaxID=330526 RepID=A0AAE0NYD8_9PEZI|nr:hypothetical protein B0H63DRAFT_519059 [Podospora didyma]
MSAITDVKRLCSSLQNVVFRRRRGATKPRLQISDPFNFRREITIIPGLSQDDLSVLREQAAATRVGIADDSLAPAFDPFFSLPASSNGSESSSLHSSRCGGRSRRPVSRGSSRSRSRRLPPIDALTGGGPAPVSSTLTIASVLSDPFSHPELDYGLDTPVSPLSPSPRSAKQRQPW